MTRALVALVVCACSGPHPPRDAGPQPPPRDAAAIVPEPVFTPPPFELPPPKDPIVEVAAGEWFGCVVRASGHVDCWDESGGVTRMPDIADAVAVAGYRETHCIARRSEITCFDYSDEPKPPRHVAIAGASALFVGPTSCALASGAISCWSAAGDGVPKRVREVRDATALVATSSGDACATVRDGHVWCSDLASTGPARWRRIKGLSDVHVLGLNDGEEGAIACAVRTGGEVTCKWIDMAAGVVLHDYYPGAMARLRGATAIVADDGGSSIDALVGGHVLTLGFDGSIVAVPVLADADRLTVHCARRAQGSVVCWGDGANGQKDTSYAKAPVPVLGVHDVVAIATSQDRSAAVTRDGRAFVWGGGVGHAVELAGSHDLASVAINGRGNANPCFLHRGGDVTCLTWGDAKPVEMGLDHVVALTGDGDYLARLADGSVRECVEPINGTTAAVHTMPDAVEVVGDAGLLCARDAAGRVSCADRDGLVCARDAAGRISCVDGRKPATSVAIGTASALAVVHGGASQDMACALVGAAVSCWQRGEYATPHAIPLGRRAVEVHGNGEHMCAKLRDGSLECWGLDAAPPKVVLPPGSLDGPFAGGQDGCTIRKDGRVACWGSNSEGRLGDGSSPYLDSPAAVPGLQ